MYTSLNENLCILFLGMWWMRVLAEYAEAIKN
jgi:hypothetical protein